MIHDFARERGYQKTWGTKHEKRILADSIPAENVAWGLSLHFGRTAPEKDSDAYFKMFRLDLPPNDLLLIAKHHHIYDGISLPKAIRSLSELSTDQIAQIKSRMAEAEGISGWFTHARGPHEETAIKYVPIWELKKAEGVAMLDHFPRGSVHARVEHYGRPRFYFQSPWPAIKSGEIYSFITGVAAVLGCSKEMAIKRIPFMTEDEIRTMRVAMKLVS